MKVGVQWFEGVRADRSFVSIPLIHRLVEQRGDKGSHVFSRVTNLPLGARQRFIMESNRMGIITVDTREYRNSHYHLLSGSGRSRSRITFGFRRTVSTLPIL